MNDLEHWIYLDGPAPESVRPLLDALVEVRSPRPTPAEKQRAIARILDRIDAGEDADTAAVRPAPPLAPAPAPPPAVEMSFDAWTELSIRMLGVPPEEQRAALAARNLAVEVWMRLDEHYLRLLSDDVRTGRNDRAARYAAALDAEVVRRGQAAPIVVNAPAALTGTGMSVELPAAVHHAMGRLPFVPAPPKPTSAKTVPVRVMPSKLGETMPLGDDSIAKAVASLPFAGSTGAPSLVRFPALTAEQYVSLRVALVVRPDSAEEILRSYRIPNDACRRVLEDHWRQEAAARPEVRAALDTALATYLGWLQAMVR